MKKSLVLCFILALMSFSTVFASEFTDVGEHWAKSSIERMANEEIANGDGNGSYRPNDYITRAEAVAMIVRAFGATEVADLSEYNDVDKDAWYYDTLAKGVAMGIIKGYGNGEMKPTANVSRQEVIAMLNRVYKFDTTNNGKELLENFEDASNVGDWAKNDMIAFLVNNYVKGYEDNTIKPTDPIKRAEVVTLLDRTIAKIIREPGEYDLSEVESGTVIIKAENVVVKGAEGKNFIASTTEVKESLKTDLKDESEIAVVSTEKTTTEDENKEDKKEENKEDKKPSSSSGGGSSSGGSSSGGSSKPVAQTAQITIENSGDSYKITKTGTIKSGEKLTVKVGDTVVVNNYTVAADESLKNEMVKIINALDVAKVVKTVSEGYNTNADFRELGFNMVLDMSDLQQQVAFSTMIAGDENKALIENVYNKMMTSELLTGDEKITDEYIKELAINNLTETFTYEEAINLLSQI